jgi:hypothetical protein
MMALALLDADFQAILAAGNWSNTSEDHKDYYAEQLPVALVQRWVQDYDPTRIETTAGLAALTLLTATAAWGVIPSDGVPADPDSKQWRGPRKGSDGKHLMSYAVGGVGIDHTDSGALVKMMDYLKDRHPALAPKAGQFFALRGIDYDEIRANGGVCADPKKEIVLDLNGVPFGHSSYGGGTPYCPDHQDGKTTLEDWQVFRHWIRAALRLRDVQRYIMERWLNNEWLPSYNAVLAAGGSVEEAMINSRIRNSSPFTAKCALGKANAGAVSDRIQAQLDAYANIGSTDCKGKSRHEERFGVMMRPVVLYRHFR